MTYLPVIPDNFVIALSQHGITSDATNGLEYGAEAPAGATGQEAAIQAVLDNAVTAAAALGLAGVRIVWDVAVALGQEIYLSSNMTIEAQNYACGAIMRAACQCPVFRVHGMDADMGSGAYTGAYIENTQKTYGMFNPAKSGEPNPQFYRVFNQSFVNAQNVEILGGTWNANSLQQAAVPYTNTNRNIGFPSTFQFWGVDGLILRDVRAFLGMQFGLWFVNCRRVILENPDVDNNQGQYYGNDAIHFNGPCQDITIVNPKTHCSDDEIAFNADDANFLTPGANWPCGGDITQARVYKHIIWSGRQGATPWGGICFRSTVSRVDDIGIFGCSGVTAAWGIWFPQYYSSQSTSDMLVPGPGNIGHVILEDINLDVGTPIQDISAISVTLNIECLEIRSRWRENAQPCPDLFVSPGITIDTLLIDGYHAYQTAGATNNSEIAVEVCGTVNLMRMRGFSGRDSSIAASAAPLVAVNEFTTSGNNNFPFSGYGGVGTLELDADGQGITNLVSVAAGCSIGTLILRGAHRASGGGSPLANAGSVGNYIPGNGSYPLAYNSGSVASYTGTAPSTINAYAESETTSLTVATPAMALAGGTAYVQGTYGGTAPSSISVAFNSGSAATVSGLTAANGHWNGTVTAPSSAGNSNTTTATGGGLSSTAPGTFEVLASGSSILQRSSFIPGTTGFASTLAAYTGSTNGDTGNAWNLTVQGNTSTPIGPYIAANGGGMSHGPLPQYSYYHCLDNIGTFPSPSAGWKFEFADQVITSGNTSPGDNLIVFQFYSDAEQANCFGVGINLGESFAFSNTIGGTTTQIGANITPSGFPAATETVTWAIECAGGNVTLYANGVAQGSTPSSNISGTLTGSPSTYSYFGWTALTNNPTPLTYTASSISFGSP